MNKYELAVVVSAKLEDEARADVIEKVKALITRFGGNVTDVDEWGKRRFAYEIQKMTEGYYYFVHFEAETTVPGEVEQRIRIMGGTAYPHYGQRAQIFMRETGSISGKRYI